MFTQKKLSQLLTKYKKLKSQQSQFTVREDHCGHCKRWTITFVVGAITGMLACGITYGTRQLTELKFLLTHGAMQDGSSIVLAGFAGLTFVKPAGLLLVSSTSGFLGFQLRSSLPFVGSTCAEGLSMW